jgi:GT2 family glycosyltransferase
MGLVQHYPAMNRPSMPVCSVCIANYNGMALLVDCLESVYAQHTVSDIEVIVHDDASADASVSLLRERYPQVELLASQENVGFCVSNNRMVAHARGEFVLLLNNDAMLMPGAIVALLQSARAGGAKDILTLTQYDWQTGTLVDRGCRLDPFYNPVPQREESNSETAMTIGACLWIRRDVWHLLGGFPVWMESIGEDLYLCCAARLRGSRVRVVAGSGYRHWQGKTFGGNRAGEDGLSSTLLRRRLSERNKTFAMFTCTPGMVIVPLLLTHLMLLMVEGILLSLIRRDTRLFRDIYLAVPRALITQRNTLYRVRHDNMAARRISTGEYFRAFAWLPRKLSLLVRYGWPRIRR